MTKPITKKELEDKLALRDAQLDGMQAELEVLRSGRVSIARLDRMLGVAGRSIRDWVGEGLPMSRNPPELFPHVELGQLTKWLQAQAYQRGKEVAEARIQELETEILHLRDDSIPPALPQDVVDILDMSSTIVSERLEDMYDLLSENAVHPGFVDDEDDVLDVIKTLGIMQSRIRSALLADFEHYAKERLAVTKERAAKADADLDAANSQLAEDLAA